MPNCKDCIYYTENYCRELNNMAAPSDPICEIFKPIVRIYISGPITHMENNNKKAFERAQGYLETLCYSIVNPLNLRHKKEALWRDYMKTDIGALMDCNKIYMLKGHEASAGAAIELNLAMLLGIEVMYE